MQKNRLVILVVEDDSDTRDFFARYLSNHGFVVYTAADANEAKEQCIKHAELDLMICDINLPGQDGCELLEDLREKYIDRDKHCYAIAITGYPVKFTEYDVTISGFDEYLIKPIDPKTLLATIIRVVRE